MRHSILAWGVLWAATCATFAEVHPTGIPALASRPGATYTIYLDFGGFSFTGIWLNGKSPGVTPAYDNAAGSFTAQQQANIANVWARVAEKYAPFNINVTTVDPAVAAGRAGTDAERQAYYDNSTYFMHTVIGGTGAWYGAGGTGVSGIRTAAYAYPAMDNGGAGAGFHTNFVFAGLASSNLLMIGEVASHENGHGLGASHQVDVLGSTLVNAYATNFGASGYGSYGPVMGSSLYAQRGTWRVGTSDKSGWPIQNDVRTIQTNPYMGNFVDDGIGHSMSAATLLPLSGAAVDPGLAKGIIVPASSTNPTPIGVSNYVSDYFWFRADGSGPVTLTAVDGGSRLTPGVADAGATLRSTLRIFDASMNLVGTATMSGSTLSETFTGTLPAGRYYAEVASAGGYTSSVDPTAMYYDMGSYFLTGSGFSGAKWVSGSGDWGTAGNWLGQVVPQVSEDVVIPAGTAAVTHATGNDVVRGVTNAGSLSVIGGTLGMKSFTQTGGSTIIGGGAGLNVSGGAIIQGGSVVVLGGAAFGAGSVTISNATLTLNASVTVPSLQLGEGGILAVRSGGLTVGEGLVAGGTAGRGVTPAGGTIVIDPGAALSVSYIRQGALVAGGTVSVRPSKEGGSTSSIGVLTLTGLGRIDLADNRLVVTTGGADLVRGYLRSAYDFGTWDGPGLTSSVARGDLSGRLAIGYATAGQLGVSEWGGVSGLTGEEVVTRLTFYGDANLDGVIDLDDFALMDRGRLSHLSGWVFGDFDYSGTVDQVDCWLLDRGYLLQTGMSKGALEAMLAGREAEFGGTYVSTLLASLPEPGGVLCVVGTMVVCGGRRRRV